MKRQRFFIKLTALLIVAGGVWFFVKQKKDLWVRESTQFLQHLLSHESQLNIQIGKISGRLSGVVRFQDVRLEDPALPAGLRLLFRAKEIEWKYHLLDFFTKKFDSKIQVTVRDPELYWRPAVSLRRDSFGWLGWAREWALTQRKNIAVRVQNLKLVYGVGAHEFRGINAEFKNDSFELRVPLDHWEAWGQDLTTQLRVKGHFETGLLDEPDSLTGEISTEGSVVNWSPLPWESQFDFSLTRERFTLESSRFLGGLEITGRMDFQKEDEVQLQVNARQYALANFEPFVGRGSASSLEGRMDLDARLQGRLDSPGLEAYARISGGRSGQNRYQAMDLHVSGVYPTLRLSDSRILMEDGSVMRFAEKTVEFKDLFGQRLYQGLISGADQDTVVMGDWEFSRPTDDSQRPEFMMQRSLGKHASLHFKKFNEASEETLDTPETHDMELGFEYRLKGKDSLKLQMREDEKFVGVERKLSF